MDLKKDFPIVLIRPPEDPRMYCVPGLERVEPPLGICYIAAVLEREGYSVSIIDGVALKNGLAKCVSLIKEKAPGIVGITCTTVTLHMAVDLARAVRAARPQALIGIGGPHASALPEKTLEDYRDFDFVVFGEGEETFLELVRAYGGEGRPDTRWDGILGLAYRGTADGNVVVNEQRPLIRDLEVLPLPARHLLGDIRKYIPQIGEYYRLPSSMMITSRGCPYGCVFCSRSVFGRTFRAHSAGYVMDELDYLIGRGAREVRFVDDLFTFKKDRVMDICGSMINRKLDLTWSCEMRVDTADAEMVVMMRKAGCWSVAFGIESGDEEVLEIIDKKIDLELVRRSVCLAAAEGIYVRGLFMLGHPKETKESIRRTINFAKSLPLDLASFSIVKVHPQTRLFHMVGQYGTMQTVDDWAEVARRGYPFNVFVPHGLDFKYMEKMQIRAHREFFIRPWYIMRQLIKSFTDRYFFKRTWKGGLVLLRMILKKIQPSRGVIRADQNI